MADEQPSEHENLARAVAQHLESASSSLCFSFTSTYEPFKVYQLHELASMKINVHDTQQRSTGRLTRAEVQVEYDVEVSARMQMPYPKGVALSKMKKFMEQLSDFFWIKRPTGCEQTLVRIANPVEAGTEAQYAETGVITAIIVLVFVGSRSIAA